MSALNLARRSARSELGAFNQMVAAHQAVAFSLAFRLLEDEGRATDAMQRSLLRAFRTFDAFQGESFRPWLLRIVADVCREMAWDAGDQGSGPNRRPASGARTPKRLNAGNGAGPVEVGISLLSYEQRLVLLLADVYGLSLQEVAGVAGASGEVVTRTLGRARRALRDFLYGDERPAERHPRPDLRTMCVQMAI